MQLRRGFADARSTGLMHGLQPAMTAFTHQLGDAQLQLCIGLEQIQGSLECSCQSPHGDDGASQQGWRTARFITMAGRPLRNQYSNTCRPGASSCGLQCLPSMHGGSNGTALSHTRLLPRVVVINHGCLFCCMAISQHLRGHTCFHIFNPHKTCASSSYPGMGMASSPEHWPPRLGGPGCRRRRTTMLPGS